MIYITWDNGISIPNQQRDYEFRVAIARFYSSVAQYVLQKGDLYMQTWYNHGKYIFSIKILVDQHGELMFVLPPEMPWMERNEIYVTTSPALALAATWVLLMLSYEYEYESLPSQHTIYAKTLKSTISPDVAEIMLSFQHEKVIAKAWSRKHFILRLARINFIAAGEEELHFLANATTLMAHDYESEPTMVYTLKRKRSTSKDYKEQEVELEDQDKQEEKKGEEDTNSDTPDVFNDDGVAEIMEIMHGVNTWKKKSKIIRNQPTSE